MVLILRMMLFFIINSFGNGYGNIALTRMVWGFEVLAAGSYVSGEVTGG